jgi:hypothetical protein
MISLSSYAVCRSAGATAAGLACLARISLGFFRFIATSLSRKIRRKPTTLPLLGETITVLLGAVIPPI